MIAVIDSNIFIKGQVNQYSYNLAYITSGVLDEVRDAGSASLLNLNSYKIVVKDPSKSFLETVKLYKDSVNLLLSEVDMSLIALCLQLKEGEFDTWIGSKHTNQDILCLTEDRDMLSALSYFNINTNKFICSKTYKIRCYACFSLYEKCEDFCKKCGYNTLTRVSVTQVGEKIKLHLKKDFSFKQKVLKGSNGICIRSSDQKEYKTYKKKQARKNNFFFKKFIDF